MYIFLLEILYVFSPMKVALSLHLLHQWKNDLISEDAVSALVGKFGAVDVKNHVNALWKKSVFLCTSSPSHPKIGSSKVRVRRRSRENSTLSSVLSSEVDVVGVSSL